MVSTPWYQRQLNQLTALQQEWQPRRRALSLLLIAGSILGVGVTALTSYWFVRGLILDSLKEKALLRVQKSGEEIDTWLSGRLSEVRAMASTYDVRSMNWDIAGPYLQLEQDRLPDYWMFILVNADGNYYTTRVPGFAKDKSGKPLNLKDREYFQTAMQGETQVSDMVISKTTGKRQINISVPIWSFPPANYETLPDDRLKLRQESLAFYNFPTDPTAKPQVIGNLAGNIPVSHVTQVVSKTELGKGSYAFALDAKGVPIAHPEPRYLDGIKSFLNSDNRELASVARQMVDRRTDIQMLQLNGKWVYVAHAPMNQARWSVALVIPRENLEEKLVPLNLLASVVGALIGAATFFALRQVHLLEKARELAGKEALLNRLTDRIRNSLELDTILQTTVDELGTLLKLDRVEFARLQPDRQRLEIVCEYRRDGVPVQLREFSLQRLGGIAERMCRGERIRVSDVRNIPELSPAIRRIYQRLLIGSYVALPVRLPEGDSSGYLICARSKPCLWSNHEVELLTAVTDQLAIAINQARLYARTQEQVDIVSQQALQLTQTSSRLTETLAHLTAIMDNLVDSLLVTDMQGMITQHNPALLKMFGIEEPNIIGLSCCEVFSREVTNLIAQAEQQPMQVFTAEVALSEKRIGLAVATAIFKTGDRAGQNSNVKEETSDIIGTVVLVRDITSEKEVDQMKTDFISTVSHELRTPLTSVLGFTKIIQKRLEEVVFPAVATDDRKVQRTIRQVDENLKIIASEGERLTTLINDVLDIAKMEAGKIDWRMEPLSIVEVVDRAIAATSALFQTRNLLLVKEVDPDLPMVLGDRDRLIQVVINLLSNAVKFTDDGSVTCRASQQGDGLVVSVVDTGMGIAPGDRDKVFEKFKQVGDTLTEKPKGTGLGLPICKQIVEHHGGQIWVESEIGQGSTFSFNLPILPTDDSTQIQRIHLETLLQHFNHTGEDVQTNPNGLKTILIVDDEVPIRHLLRQYLEAEGYLVEEARDGREAIARIKQVKPHLVILDIVMPEMNGFDAAAVLKNDPQTMGIPIIILSVAQEEQRGNRLGVDCYLTKPIDSEKLLQTVNDLISQGSSRRKVLVVDENEPGIKTLIDVLQSRGFTVMEVSSDTELVEKALVAQPDMVIANARFWEHSTAVKTLKFEKGFENILFLLIAEQTNNGSTQS